MANLIKALQIFLKYGNPRWPTNCDHDLLYVDIDSNKVSDEDKKELEVLGFFPSNEDDGFESFEFGSC